MLLPHENSTFSLPSLCFVDNSSIAYKLNTCPGYIYKTYYLRTWMLKVVKQHVFSEDFQSKYSDSKIHVCMYMCVCM